MQQYTDITFSCSISHGKQPEPTVMLTGEAPTMNLWYNKEGRRKEMDLHCRISEELTILRPRTISFKNDKLLTEPPSNT